MASEFTQLNEIDTKKLRKEIGLPVTKGIIYWRRDTHYTWKKMNVVDYEIVATYEPSGTKSLLITLEDGSRVRILADYLADMQKTTFFNDIGDNTEKQQKITGKMGCRVESDVATYIVVDLETTGTNHCVDEITEIGAIKYAAGKETDRFSVFVKTEVEIPKKVERLTGISNDMLRMFGVEPKEALEQFRAFIGNSVVVGHNFTTFDSKFLEDAYVRELNCHFSNDYIDTLYLAKKSLPNLQRHTLECLAEEYNIDYSKAHRAVEDCMINHKVYEYLTFGYLLCDESEQKSVKKELGNSVTSGISGDTANADELIEVNASEGWQAKLSSQFAELESRFGLMEHSFSIMENVGKEGKTSSYAICVYEPDLVEDRRDSSRNTVLARVKENVLKSKPNVVVVYSKSFENNEKKRFEKDSAEFMDCLIECIQNGIDNYVPKAAGFACCSRYEACSNAQKCIHPNLLYAKACQYRKNLESGQIFY